MSKLIVVFSGSGISAESGIKTFRDYDGLWENHRIEVVASPEGFRRDPQMVLNFYNDRRLQLLEVKPNQAHDVCVQLADFGRVVVITQNVDDLHERAGSQEVIHLHGELNKAQNTVPPFEIVDVTGQRINLGDHGQNEGQLRPYIVWFGEEVRFMEEAVALVQGADYLVIVGTSLQVWPAAGLVNETKLGCKSYLVDPNPPASQKRNITVIAEPASVGMQVVYDLIKADQL